MTTYEQLAPDDLPRGYAFGFSHDNGDDGPNQYSSLNMRVSQGLPLTPARIEFCHACRAPVYVSERCCDDFNRTCYECADEMFYAGAA